MTNMTEPIVLTTKDHAILEQMLGRCLGTLDPLHGVIENKLATARIVGRDALPADIVSINSRVSYRTGDGPVETRVLVHEDRRGMVGLTLPLSHPRGIAMLGLRAGASTGVPLPDGRIEMLTVVQIPYQPEAVRHAKPQTQSSLSLVTSGLRLSVMRPDNDCGGPGPSVA